MGITRVHGLYAVEIDSVGDTAVVLGGITQLDIKTGTRVERQATSGNPHVYNANVVEQKPVATFTTLDLALALATAGQEGKAISSDVTDPGLNLYARKRAEGGTRTTGSTHRQYNIKEGILVPRTISIQHRGNATLSYEALATFDGTNDPVVITDSSAIPTVAAGSDAVRFTLGAVSLESVTIAGIQSMELDFGVTAETFGGDSDVWETFATIGEIMALARFTGIDIEWLKAANIPLGGKAITHANTLIEFRKRANGGQFVADATEEHISITAAGIAFIDDAFRASENGAGETSIAVPLYHDGTNNPLVIDTTAALA
jgi:hypothetical protein